MSNHPKPKPEVEAIKAKIFDDLATIDDFAEATNKSRRTVFRLIGEGKLPAVKMGQRRYIVLSKARDAMLASSAA